MKRLLPWIAVLAFVSVPLWLKDPYLLNACITTGIFILICRYYIHFVKLYS